CPGKIPVRARIAGEQRMKFGRQLAACVLSCVATVAYCDPDPSFVLSTTSVAVDSYFPTYLANGYLSTMTGARGTESNLAYLVAFMDYTKEDIAPPRPFPAGAASTTAPANRAPESSG